MPPKRVLTVTCSYNGSSPHLTLTLIILRCRCQLLFVSVVVDLLLIARPSGRVLLVVMVAHLTKGKARRGRAKEDTSTCGAVSWAHLRVPLAQWETGKGLGEGAQE